MSQVFMQTFKDYIAQSKAQTLQYPVRPIVLNPCYFSNFISLLHVQSSLLFTDLLAVCQTYQRSFSIVTFSICYNLLASHKDLNNLITF